MVVFPELALTTFFPRMQIEDDVELDAFFENTLPGPDTRKLFDTATRLGIGFYIGFAERTSESSVIHRFNTSVLVTPDGDVVARYRKIHLPGHREFEPWRAFQHLEKRYFEPGNLGFGVWPFMGARVGMCICNDRRWPETWRVMGLQGAELVVLGYNNPLHYPPVPQHDHLQSFHHLLPMQAGAYQNGSYVAAAAKAGHEEGTDLLGNSCIIAPTGEIIAMSHTCGDEVISAECDFTRCTEIKQHIFDFAMHRQPKHYAIIAQDPTPPAPPPPLFNTDIIVAHVHNDRSRASVPRDFDVLTAEACQMAREAISAWPDYAPTPLQSLAGLASRLDIRTLHYKDEAGRFGLGSFKALGGAYAVSVILLKRLSGHLGRPATLADLSDGSHRDFTRSITVSCATDGNHGRSVAWGAERFGCRCVIYIHQDVSDGRQSAIEHFGASVVRVAGNYDDTVRQATEDATRLDRIVVSDTSWPGYRDIPADVMRGYTVLADEALDQLGTAFPTHVFLQGGVGGFAAAVMARVRARATDHQPRLVVVEPDKAACIYESIRQRQPVTVSGRLDTVMAGLACGEVSLVAFDTLLAEADDVITLPDEAAIACMGLLAEGIDGDTPLVAGESSVAGLAALVIARARPKLSE